VLDASTAAKPCLNLTRRIVNPGQSGTDEEAQNSEQELTIASARGLITIFSFQSSLSWKKAEATRA
jgi:hypothetical protein